MKRRILLAAAASLMFVACAHQVDRTADTDTGTNDVRRVDTSTTGSATGASDSVYDPSAIGHPADSGLALDSGNLPRTATVGNSTRYDESRGTSSGKRATPKHRVRSDRMSQP